MVECGSCGKPNPDGSAYCNQCGKAIASEKARPSPNLADGPSVAVPPFLQDVVILQPKELAVRLWKGSRQIFVMANGQETPRFESGYLMVTNQRIIFISELGFINTSYSATEVIALENVTGISVKPGFFTDLLIIGHGQNGYSDSLNLGRISELVLDGSGKQRAIDPSNFSSIASIKYEDLQDIDDMLSGFVQKRLREVDEERRRARVQVVLDFSFLKSELERGGVVVQTIRCPSCGAGLSMPSSGATARCSYCGSTVRAQDVFEKMKGLIAGI